MKIETLAVHAGRRADPATGAVTPPIHLSTTFERAADGEYPLGFSYAREGNPNRAALEECLAALEGGKEALVFSSGLAVATAVLQGLEPGDHILAPDDVYYGLRKVIGEVFGKWGLETDYVDMTDLAAVRAAVRKNTRLIWVETPSNPLMKITDLEAIARIARSGNAISVCDGTFATPVLQRPLERGIDMVTHSTTKYIGGHSDLTGGVLINKYDNYLFERARNSQRFGGAAPSPFDCWLTLRGVATLPWRVRAQAENARRIAEFLRAHPAVEAVHYPGLADHPGYAVAARQMSAGGGMLSFQVRGGRQAAVAAAARVRVFTRATSLGGPHSFIEHRASIEGPQTRTPPNLLRMSVGLEHVEDLIGDLKQALAG
ncbi:MAG TPA: aminotransferase class I/II-fold pyridoxal phosphate-dependent enzyme [Bryobacteraceae bacterium]|nr:aminotransferase class I/II-fold pyridoxal phosphate-dependent enzyme [Bryobacteraceae bacterium]